MRQCLDAQMGEAVTLPTSKFDINERMKLLRTIGLKASPKRSDSGSGKVPSAFISCRNTKEWDNRFAELLRYKSINGNCDVPVKSEGDFKSLGRWVTAQRKKHKEFHAGEIGSDNSGLYTCRFTRWVAYFAEKFLSSLRVIVFRVCSNSCLHVYCLHFAGLKKSGSSS